MAKIFDRLNYNFDPAKFGNAVDPNGDVAEQLALLPPLFSAWQYEAIANNDVAGYVRNPNSNSIIYLKSTANTIINMVANGNVTFSLAPDEANTLANNLITFVVELNNFEQHTNNLSSVSVSTDATIPDYNSAMGVGEIILMLTSKYDGIQNNIPILGSFTSLFIDKDLANNVSVINNDYITIINSIDGSNNSNLTSNSVNTIIGHVTTTNTLIYTSRTQDVNYYRNAVTVMNDYMKMARFSNFSPLSIYLIQNYIGTDKLKSQL